MRLLAAILAVAFLLLGAAASATGQSAFGAASPLDGQQPQAWLIPSPVKGESMRATLFRPSGSGPFPLAVINHGSEENAGARRQMPTPAYPVLTDLLLRLGYAVLVPQRPGHGPTGGKYLESQGRCASANYVQAGQSAAASILIALDYMRQQDFIKQTGAVIIGNSAGGWGGLAVAATNPPGVSAVVNFSGGRGGRDRNIPNRNCSPDRLVEAAATFGQTARVPTLWLYARNDSYFAPDLSMRMSDAFARVGGSVEYHLFPAIGGDGHSLIFESSDVAPWQSILTKFLGK